MALIQWKKAVLCVLYALCLFKSAHGQDGDEGPLDFLENKYKSLSPRGKFIAGATVGFVGSRIAVKTAMSVVKIGAAAFITAEVLHYTGVLEDLPGLSEDQTDMLNAMKGSVVRKANAFRVSVRRRLSPEAVQYMFDNERIGALGLASGAFMGTVI